MEKNRRKIPEKTEILLAGPKANDLYGNKKNVETEKKYEKLKAENRKLIDYYYNLGFRDFATLGERGYNMITAENIIDLKMKHDDVALTVITGSADAHKQWGESVKSVFSANRFERILESADTVIDAAKRYQEINHLTNIDISRPNYLQMSRETQRYKYISILYAENDPCQVLKDAHAAASARKIEPDKDNQLFEVLPPPDILRLMREREKMSQFDYSRKMEQNTKQNIPSQKRDDNSKQSYYCDIYRYENRDVKGIYIGKYENGFSKSRPTQFDEESFEDKLQCRYITDSIESLVNYVHCDSSRWGNPQVYYEVDCNDSSKNVVIAKDTESFSEKSLNSIGQMKEMHKEHDREHSVYRSSVEKSLHYANDIEQKNVVQRDGYLYE